VTANQVRDGHDSHNSRGVQIDCWFRFPFDLPIRLSGNGKPQAIRLDIPTFQRPNAADSFIARRR
jgi:hypothetical protein